MMLDDFQTSTKLPLIIGVDPQDIYHNPILHVEQGRSEFYKPHTGPTFRRMKKFAELTENNALDKDLNRLWILQVIGDAAYSKRATDTYSFDRDSYPLALQSMQPIHPLDSDHFCYKRGMNWFDEENNLPTKIKALDPSEIYVFGFFLESCVSAALRNIREGSDIPCFVLSDLTPALEQKGQSAELNRICKTYNAPPLDSSDFLSQFGLSYETHLPSDRAVPSIPQSRGAGDFNLWSR